MLVAPAGTSPAIVRQLNAEVEKALARPDTLAALLSEGSTPMHGDPAQAAAFAKSEYERWGKLVRDAHVKLD
jgi:tripartite-type tricarboxylate transporter receptor subunit TctC